MGAIDFCKRGKGSSMKDAFQKLQQIAVEEHGYDYYNGEINNANLMGDKTAAYKNAENKKKFLDELTNDCSKGEAYGICLKPPKANTNKVKSRVIIKPANGTRKWETRYMADDIEGRIVCEEKTQVACIKRAREWAEKQQQTVYLYITKQLVNNDPSIGRVEYKASKTESLGEYLFVGVVPS